MQPGQMPMQPGAVQGYPGQPGAAPGMPIQQGIPVAPVAPAGPPMGTAVTPVQPTAPTPDKSWIPTTRTGRVGSSVETAITTGATNPGQKTSAAKSHRRRSRSQSPVQILVIVIAGAVVLLAFLLALFIAFRQ